METRKIKCVVWDLDNTVWNGILSEGDDVKLKEETVKVIKELDKRGVLNSISSKNEHESAMKKLDEFNLSEYFLYPQINWNLKSTSILRIKESINIGMDTIAFVDDQAFERDEVKYTHCDVLCLDVKFIPMMLQMPEFIPRFVTEDSKNRRKLYQNNLIRNMHEDEFVGPKEEFLASLKMKFTISKANEEDLKRAEELTVRTHQLNSTGIVYSYNELKSMIESNDYEVYASQLEDKYGSYGKIGIMVIKKDDNAWTLKLLLMSCRVMSKGVGSVMINFIMNEALKAKIDLYSDFLITDRNRIMYITFKLNGFKEVNGNDKKVKFIADLKQIKEYPDYIKVVC